MTIAFESFIDFGGLIHNQMDWNKKKQNLITIIRAIKSQTKVGSAIWSEGINLSLAENISFSIDLDTSISKRKDIRNRV
jgi:hypothetical protein